MHSCFLFAYADYSNLAAQEIIGGPRMSYGSIDAGSFGSRNPFGGPTRQGYQPVGKDKFFFSCPQPGVLSIYHQALLEKKYYKSYDREKDFGPSSFAKAWHYAFIPSP